MLVSQIVLFNVQSRKDIQHIIQYLVLLQYSEFPPGYWLVKEVGQQDPCLVIKVIRWWPKQAY